MTNTAIIDKKNIKYNLYNIKDIYTPPFIEKYIEVTEDNIIFDVTIDIHGDTYYRHKLAIHRLSGPAIIKNNGDKFYYQKGHLHRIGAPAIELTNGIYYYYQNGKLHRDDGSAFEIDDVKYYYSKGVLHRNNGPAIEFANGDGHYYINGKFQKEENMSKSIVKNPKPKTQKAKSILYGCPMLQEQATYCYPLRGYGTKTLKMGNPILIQSVSDIDALPSSSLKGKIFARPCPKIPRHGFVDSRVVSNKTELRNLLKEVFKQDPQGEIVLTKFLDKAVCSAVLTTNGTISIGPGHNGATAGKKSFSFGVKPEQLPLALKKKSGLHNFENAFIETVFSPPQNWYESFYYTQVRGGPAIQSVSDFVPKKIVVKKIIKPNDNLVAWEKQVQKLPSGTVVYGPGHTLASHAAIHCVVNNIPFITSYVPKVGQKIQPSLAVKSKFNIRDFRVGFNCVFNNETEMSKMLHVSVAILHNWAYLRASDKASWLLGLSSGLFIKVLAALNLGEYRYYGGGSTINRETIYKNVIKSSKFNIYMKKFPQIAKDFKNKKIFNSGFGGSKWSKATYMCLDIWNIIATIHQNGLKESHANDLVKTLNKAVNLVHNNGWLFNKISDQVLMTFIAHHSSLALLQLADIVYFHHKQSSKVKYLKAINKVVLPK